MGGKDRTKRLIGMGNKLIWWGLEWRGNGLRSIIGMCYSFSRCLKILIKHAAKMQSRSPVFNGSRVSTQGNFLIFDGRCRKNPFMHASILGESTLITYSDIPKDAKTKRIYTRYLIFWFTSMVTTNQKVRSSTFLIILF